jgi:hypothetical protein
MLISLVSDTDSFDNFSGLNSTDFYNQPDYELTNNHLIISGDYEDFATSLWNLNTDTENEGKNHLVLLAIHGNDDISLIKNNIYVLYSKDESVNDNLSSNEEGNVSNSDSSFNDTVMNNTSNNNSNENINKIEENKNEIIDPNILREEGKNLVGSLPPDFFTPAGPSGIRVKRLTFEELEKILENRDRDVFSKETQDKLERIDDIEDILQNLSLDDNISGDHDQKNFEENFKKRSNEDNEDDNGYSQPSSSSKRSRNDD